MTLLYRTAGPGNHTRATSILKSVPINIIAARCADVCPGVEEELDDMLMFEHACGLQGGLAVPSFRRRVDDPCSLGGVGVP